MTNVIKELGNQALEEMYALATYAFNSQDTDERRERFKMIVENSWNYGFLDPEGHLTSQVMATPFSVDFYGKNYLMAGIGYVASYPEARGQGGINRIMEKILEDCRERNVTLSYLAPFSYPFYRRYGYEQLFDRISYELASRDMPAIKKTTGYMKRTSFEESVDAIRSIYTNMPESTRGGLVREEWWYSYKFKQRKENQYALYYDREGNATGYVVYKLAAPTFIIVEMGYLNHEALKGLMRFVGSHSGAFDSFEYTCGFSGYSKNYLLDNPFAKTTITPYMMGRIVDVEKFMQTYPFRHAINFSIHVTEDPYAKWNEGFFDISYVNGVLEVKKVQQTELPVVSGTIQSLTQLLLGYQTVEELNFHEKIKVEGALVAELSQALPNQQPILNDYF